MNALPTRKQEDWRYSDVAAIAPLWPLPAAQHIAVGEGESAAHHLLQDAAAGSVAVHDYAITIGAGGSLDFHILNIGGRLGRVQLALSLGAGAHFSLGGAIIGGDDQVLEIVTTVSHAEPGATSTQTVRAIVGGQATASYLGKVAVARHAQKTNASQSFKAMLLSRTATANARPELEIFADDVQCAHGATVGELDRAALFYMESRGMDPLVARTLLLRSFVAGVFDGIAHEDERTRFEQAALAKLEGLA